MKLITALLPLFNRRIKLSVIRVQNYLFFLSIFHHVAFGRNREGYHNIEKIGRQCDSPGLYLRSTNMDACNSDERNLKVEQKAMERRISKISLLRHKTNEVVREVTKVRDVWQKQKYSNGTEPDT
jgi:hypothetical protein